MTTHQFAVDREERMDALTTNSFHWTGEALNPNGHTWRLEGDFRVTRMR